MTKLTSNNEKIEKKEKADVRQQCLSMSFEKKNNVCPWFVYEPAGSNKRVLNLRYFGNR
jgi:hypothetical protein